MVCAKAFQTNARLYVRVLRDVLHRLDQPEVAGALDDCDDWTRWFAQVERAMNGTSDDIRQLLDDLIVSS